MMVTGLSGGPGFLLVNRQPQFHSIPTPSVCLSQHSQPQSFPQVQSLKPRFQHPSPSSIGRHACQAGECRAAAPSVQLSVCCGCHKQAAVLSSETQRLPFCPNHSSWWWGGFSRYRNLSSLTALSQGHSFWPNSFFFLMFFHTQLHGDFLGFSVVWGLLPVFSRYSVRIVLHIDVF